MAALRRNYFLYLDWGSCVVTFVGKTELKIDITRNRTKWKYLNISTMLRLFKLDIRYYLQIKCTEFFFGNRIILICNEMEIG